jgi:hypothetical protein
MRWRLEQSITCGGGYILSIISTAVFAYLFVDGRIIEQQFVSFFDDRGFLLRYSDSKEVR